MCGGLKYTHANPETGEIIERKAFFPVPHVQIPVLDEEGSTIRFVQWGRRKGEDEDFDVPQTGWARLQSLVEGKWHRYAPRKVRIPAQCWMEKDASKQSHWFDMVPGSYLLGVDIEYGGREFVYIVTRPAPPEFAHIHHRIPLITKVTGNRES